MYNLTNEDFWRFYGAFPWAFPFYSPAPVGFFIIGFIDILPFFFSFILLCFYERTFVIMRFGDVCYVTLMKPTFPFDVFILHP
jgi:hypothetical protein